MFWVLASLVLILFWYLISVSWIHLFILFLWFLSQTSVDIVPLMYKNVHLLSLIKHSACLPRANYSSPISPPFLQNQVLRSAGQLVLISDCWKSCFSRKDFCSFQSLLLNIRAKTNYFSSDCGLCSLQRTVSPTPPVSLAAKPLSKDDFGLFTNQRIQSDKLSILYLNACQMGQRANCISYCGYDLM